MLDEETQSLISIFQTVFHLSYVERDQVKYVKRYAGAIKSTGQLFEYLGLATSQRKIDAFSIVVNSAWQRKTRRGNRRGVPRSMCRGD